MVAARKKGQNKAKTTTRKAGQTRGGPSRTRRSAPGRLLLDLLLLSWIGRVLLAILVIAAVLGLNLLISANQYDLFFIFLGIELVAVALFFWLRMALKRS